MILAADWVTISSLATAGATLVLAFATFAAVRSANRAARAAELSLMAGIRPLLVPSRLDDAPQKAGFFDGRWFTLPGAGAVAEATDEAIYLLISVRNAGTGMAVLHSWCLHGPVDGGPVEHSPLDRFRRLSRDLYVAGGEIGFWQGAYRDPSAPEFAEARALIEAGERLMIEVLYGDQEGGQRAISLFSLTRRDDGAWIATVARHWNLDRPDPR